MWTSVFITTKILTSMTNLISVSTVGGEASEENVSKNAQAPDVRCQADRLIGQDFRSWGFCTSGYLNFRYLDIKILGL